MTTWKIEILEAMASAGESWNDVISLTLSNRELNREFDRGFGVIEGAPFTLWTKNRVYFPVKCDGAEWAASVARNPDGVPTDHVGG